MNGQVAPLGPHVNGAYRPVKSGAGGGPTGSCSWATAIQAASAPAAATAKPDPLPSNRVLRFEFLKLITYSFQSALVWRGVKH